MTIPAILGARADGRDVTTGDCMVVPGGYCGGVHQGRGGLAVGIAPFDALTQGYAIPVSPTAAVPVGFGGPRDRFSALARFVCWLTVRRAGSDLRQLPRSFPPPIWPRIVSSISVLGFSAIVGLLLEHTTYTVLLSAGGVVLAMLVRSHRCLDDRVRPGGCNGPGEAGRVFSSHGSRHRIKLWFCSKPRIAPDDPLVASDWGSCLSSAGRSEALSDLGPSLCVRDAVALNNRGAVDLRIRACGDGFSEALNRRAWLMRRNLRCGCSTPLGWMRDR